MYDLEIYFQLTANVMVYFSHPDIFTNAVIKIHHMVIQTDNALEEKHLFVDLNNWSCTKFKEEIRYEDTQVNDRFDNHFSCCFDNRYSDTHLMYVQLVLKNEVTFALHVIF
jgi:hypothetical protein